MNESHLLCSPSVSIIVPCRNECSYIESFLENILHQELLGLSVDVIVADGMSDDGTQAIVQSFSADHPNIYVLNNENLTVSAGLNLAILFSRSDIVIRMDVHTRYQSDYIYNSVSALISTKANCVGGPWIAHGTNVKQRAIAAAFQSPLCSGFALSRRSNYDGPVDTVYLGAWWREYIINIGLFDEALVRNQDDELCLRIRKSGGSIYQSSSIRSLYLPRSSFRLLFFQYFQYGYWKAYVISKYSGRLSTRNILLICLVILFLLYLCVLIFTGSLAAKSLFLASFFLLYCSGLLIPEIYTQGTRLPFLHYLFLPFAVLVMQSGYVSGLAYALLTRLGLLSAKPTFFRVITR
jgi:succinoglycan biosynthesis protein ExoA